MARPTQHSPPADAPDDLRCTAIETLKKLVEAGFIAYFAGGCVRDRLMGHAPEDYDIATNATPAQVATVFPRVQTVGESFGVMLVRVKKHTIQVATFRTEGVYSDGRRPDSVAFSDAEHDASRRDFTINGLFENPLTGEIIDYVGGRVDLERRVIRAIGDPQARLREDRLRMLRAVRFAARFGFAIDPATVEAIRAGADQLQGVSRERIGQEIKRMLSDRSRAEAASLLQSLGLDEQVLQEPSRSVALSRLASLPPDVQYPTALAAWLLDRHGGDQSNLATHAAHWSDALMLSNEERFVLADALDVYQTLTANWPHLGVAGQKRLASRDAFQAGVQLIQATDQDRFEEIQGRVAELEQTGLSPKPLIDGSHLIGFGLKPGPIFSRVLEAVYDAQLEGSVQSREKALDLAKSLAVEFGKR